MQMLYSAIMILLIILGIFRLSFIFEKDRLWLQLNNAFRRFFELFFVLLLVSIGLIGCFEMPNSHTLYFTVIYIACYFLIKEIYSWVIIERRQKVFQIEMQKLVEKEFDFCELFEFEHEKVEKSTIKTAFSLRESYKKHWICEFSEGTIGILFNDKAFTQTPGKAIQVSDSKIKKRFFFTLKDKQYEDSVPYIVSQLESSVESITTIEALNSIKVKAITNGKIAKRFKHEFINYNKNDESKRSPIVYKDTMFYLAMVSGYIAGISLVKLLFDWCILSVFAKVVIVIGGSIFALVFLGGMLTMIIVFIELFKKEKTR